MISDLASEKAVLAGLIQYGSDGYADVADLINLNTFCSESNQIIYKCLEYVLKDKVNVKIDLATIYAASNALGISRIMENEDERKHLRAVMNFPINQSNVRVMAKRIRKLQIAREANSVVEDIKTNLVQVTGDEPIDQILGIIENPVYDFALGLSDGKTEGPQKISEGLEEYVDFLGKNPVETVGISSGYKQYDEAIGGGFRRKTVNMIGARPKIGKTMLADNIAMHVAGVEKVPVLNLDTEMSREDHWNRMLANISKVNIKDIETGKFASNPKKKEAVNKAVAYLKSMPYEYVSIAGMPFEEIVSIMRRWIMKSVGLEDSGQAKPCLIIYDYLKLMSSDSINKNMQEYQVLGFQMTGLHNFMVRYGASCLSFIQLNRDGITKEDTDAASGSDRIIWLCSNFTIYKPKTDEEIAEEADLTDVVYNRKLVPIIARHGAGMESGDYINMHMDGPTAKIEEGQTRNEVHGSNNKKNKNKGVVNEKSGPNISEEDRPDF
jgi:replicative DNA helicase